MRYYIGADGGGTKLLSVLFDENFNIIGRGRGGGINPNFTDHASIEKNMLDSITGCLSGSGVTEVERLYITMPGPAELYEALLRRYCAVVKTKLLSEGSACVLSGLLSRRGFTALAGTGSGAYYVENGEPLYGIGGWGALFGDEGSGYDIGARALRAAQFAYDGRGQPTILVDMIISAYNLKNLRGIVGYTYKDSNYRAVISGVCLLVRDAAEKGDETARRIMREAGRSQGMMIDALIRKNGIKSDAPAVVSGSVWKRNPIMFEGFREYLSDRQPSLTVKKPVFEPVVSGAVDCALDERGCITPEKEERLRAEFSDFLYLYN